MDHLSSCYFCSSALDEPLGTYTVSGTGGEIAVTLCSTCHRKLDLIFDTSGTVSVEARENTGPEPGRGTVDGTADLIPDEDEPGTGDDDAAVEASTDDSALAAPNEEDSFADEDTDDSEEGLEAQMEPDIPVEFGEADDSEEEISGEEPDAEILDDEADTPVLDDESDTERPEEPSEVDSGIDPSILQADEIATGKLDIDEALGEEADPDPAADEQAEDVETDDSGASDEGAGADGPEIDFGDGTDDADRPADDGPTGEEIDQIIGELDEEIEELGRGAEVEDGRQADEASEEDRTEAGEEDRTEASGEAEDGGFAFDQGSEADKPEDKITSEMEPDIPEEFDTGGTDETDDEESSDDSERIIFGADSMVRDDLVDDESDDDPAEPDEADQAAASTGSEIADEADGLEDTGGSAGDDTPAESDDQPDAGEAAETADRGEPSTDDKPSISALEYNKVMRLLQNREFPVDREEVVTVAANAYQLSEADCLAVIDLAVDRGLLAEDGDALVRPD